MSKILQRLRPEGGEITDSPLVEDFERFCEEVVQSLREKGVDIEMKELSEEGRWGDENTPAFKLPDVAPRVKKNPRLYIHKGMVYGREGDVYVHCEPTFSSAHVHKVAGLTREVEDVVEATLKYISRLRETERSLEMAEAS